MRLVEFAKHNFMVEYIEMKNNLLKEYSIPNLPLKSYIPKNGDFVYICFISGIEHDKVNYVDIELTSTTIIDDTERYFKCQYADGSISNIYKTSIDAIEQERLKQFDIVSIHKTKKDLINFWLMYKCVLSDSKFTIISVHQDV